MLNFVTNYTHVRLLTGLARRPSLTFNAYEKNLYASNNFDA